MRKKIIALLMISLVIFCACGKSEEAKMVEELIYQIGEVSFSSAEGIQHAQEAYDALSSEDKKSVKNYQTLVEAKKEFDSLGIQLTLDNYSKYLNVDADIRLAKGSDFGTYNGTGVTIGRYVYEELKTSVSVSGKSSNYNYNDIAVTVRFVGSYTPINGWDEDFQKYDVDFELTAQSDIIGDGYAEKVIEMPSGYFLLENNCVQMACEVVDVSGFMVPA